MRGNVRCAAIVRHTLKVLISAMTRKSGPPIEHATQHTAIIRDHGGMWSKLVWDVDVFRDIQVSYPDEREPLAYAAINVCIAAWSLREWVRGMRQRTSSQLNLPFDHSKFLRELLSAVPEQAACEAIANTAKHARIHDGNWVGGMVRISWYDGDEDCPPGYTLHHDNKDGSYEGLAVNRFAALCDNWWAYLQANNLAIGQNRIPDWQQRKLKSIFGERPIPVLPD